MISLFPLGGQQGTILEAEIQGRNLEGTYAIWFAAEGLRTRVEKAEEIELEDVEDYESEEEQARSGHRVLFQVEIDPATALGAHTLWLVSRRGVSNPVPFWVHSDPVILERKGMSDRRLSHAPDRVQQVSFPTVIHGKINQDTELDYYQFEVLAGQELVLEVIPWGFESELGLYEATGSWFEPNRVRQLALASQDKYTTAPQLTFRFSKGGRYLARVGFFANVSSQFGPDSSYQLRIASAGTVSQREKRAGPRADSAWRERTFEPRLRPDRLQTLWSRTLEKPQAEASIGEGGSLGVGVDKGALADAKGTDFSVQSAILSIKENEPNETADQALALSVPVLIEGAIERPGDVDSFRLKVKDGEKIAFELETPGAVPPFFNPRLGIFGTDGREFLTNIYQRVGRQFQFYRKTVEAKTVYTFELGGELTLQIRDITSRYGDPSFLYRLLIRPQIPHVGELKLQEERVNLGPGEAKKLTVVTDQEEGFTGEIALKVENLPPGVEALPGTEVEPDRGPTPDEGPKERFVAKSQTATILLMASPDAPATELPQFLRIVARPIIEGSPGSPLAVGEVPLMVVNRVAK